MIFNAYQDTDTDLFGISVVSSGHIFAQQGRTISRPNGRPDYLLFYVAKGSEHLFLNSEIELTEGSFVIFRDEKQNCFVLCDAKTMKNFAEMTKKSFFPFFCIFFANSNTLLKKNFLTIQCENDHPISNI